MFTQVIDTIQDGKKKVITATVTDAKVADELIKLVNSQTEFYKGWVNTTLSLAQTLVANAPKFPFQGAK